MVKVIFNNLIRSKYLIEEEYVNPGNILEIIEQILAKNPEMKLNDFKNAVFFYQGNIYHFTQSSTKIEDNQELMITHFVGGG